MKVTTRLVLILLGPLLVSATMAQGTTDDEADVLLAIEREWDASREGDQKKIDNMLTQDFMGWGKNSPAPTCRSVTSHG